MLTAELRKGGRLATEIHLFGRLADDGRLRQVDQFIRVIRA